MLAIRGGRLAWRPGLCTHASTQIQVALNSNPNKSSWSWGTGKDGMVVTGVSKETTRRWGRRREMGASGGRARWLRADDGCLAGPVAAASARGHTLALCWEVGRRRRETAQRNGYAAQAGGMRRHRPRRRRGVRGGRRRPGPQRRRRDQRVLVRRFLFVLFHACSLRYLLVRGARLKARV